jgi:uridine phosphorylase
VLKYVRIMFRSALLRSCNPRLVRRLSSRVSNPNLAAMAGDDYLYHIGLNPASDDLAATFGDVRFVCLGGSVPRMAEFAARVAHELGVAPSAAQPIGKTDRYSLFKVGPALISSHGMGQPSMSILLHELAKLLHYAGARDPVWMRMGTSGGVGVAPGTVVVSTEGVNGMLECGYELPILGRRTSRPSLFGAATVGAIVDAAAARPETAAMVAGGRVVRGKTMSADCFYEGQGRLDGALCEYGEADKMTFLRRAHDKGVRNIEMEALQFGAFTHRLGIRAAACCVTLLDRLEGDQVRATPEQLAQWDAASGDVVLSYIKHELGLPAPE